MKPLLYGYQRRWFQDQARFKLGKFARQTGKTFTTTLECVDDSFEHVVKQARTRWVILSRGERQAKEAMEEGVKIHAKAYGLTFDAYERDYDIGAVSYRALEVDFPHGSKIMALPANPDTARGFSANVFLDEFAFHKDSGAIWKALFPVISAGWKLRVTSTPNGKSGKFYELDTAADSVWSRHSVDIYQAVADGLPRDIEELRAGLADEDAWAQEYELKYLDEASAWLTYELITAVEDPRAGDPDLYEGGVCYIGVDIGRRHDLFDSWVVERVGLIIGTVRLVPLPFDRGVGEIKMLGVLAEHRKQGWGPKLIGVLEEKAQALGLNELRLAVRHDQYRLVEWYSSLGYTLNPRLVYSAANPLTPPPFVLHKNLEVHP